MYRSVFVYHPVQCVPKNVSGCIAVYYHVLLLYYIMSIHEPLIHHKYAVIRQKYMYSMSSHMSCADTNPIHAQYVRYMHNTSSIRVLPSDAVDTARYTVDTQPIRSRYAADTQPIRRLYIVTCPLPQAEGAGPPPRHSSLGPPEAHG